MSLAPDDGSWREVASVERLPGRRVVVDGVEYPVTGAWTSREVFVLEGARCTRVWRFDSFVSEPWRVERIDDNGCSPSTVPMPRTLPLRETAEDYAWVVQANASGA